MSRLQCSAAEQRVLKGRPADTTVVLEYKAWILHWLW